LNHEFVAYSCVHSEEFSEFKQNQRVKQRRLKFSLQWLDIIEKVCISQSSGDTECTDGDLATEFLTFLQDQKKKQKYSLLSSTHLSLVLSMNCFYFKLTSQY
jgi:hypothetical protein